MIWYMYTSENVDVYKKLQSVSTRKGHKHMWVCTAWVYVQELYIYTYLCVCFKVCTGKAETHVISHNLSSYTKVSIIRYMYTFGWMYIYKEVLSVGVREGSDICEFAQHRFISKSSDDIIHVYLWIYVCIQDHTRGSKCECVQGREHMRYMKCCIKMLYIWILTVVISRGSNC